MRDDEVFIPDIPLLSPLQTHLEVELLKNISGPFEVTFLLLYVSIFL